MGAPVGLRILGRKGEAGCLCLWDCTGPEGASDERGRQPRSTAGKGRHRAKLLVPEVGAGGTYCAVKLLAQKAETSLVLLRPRAMEVTPGAVGDVVSEGMHCRRGFG